MIIKCDNCGKDFNKKPKHIRKSIKHYCSTKCSHEGRRGKRPPIDDSYEKGGDVFI